MKQIRIALLILSVSILACGQYVTPAPAVSPTETSPTARPAQLVTVSPTQTVSAPASIESVDTAKVVSAIVYVRSAPSGDVIKGPKNYVSAGDTVTVESCSGSWCKISAPVSGYIWRGCISDNPEALRCEAAE